MARLIDRNGNILLMLKADQILDADSDLLAMVERRTALTPSGIILGRVTQHGRFIDGEALEVVVVVNELRDAMGEFIGRFEDATPTERGLLALVYRHLVRDS